MINSISEFVQHAVHYFPTSRQNVSPHWRTLLTEIFVSELWIRGAIPRLRSILELPADRKNSFGVAKQRTILWHSYKYTVDIFTWPPSSGPWHHLCGFSIKYQDETFLEFRGILLKTGKNPSLALKIVTEIPLYFEKQRRVVKMPPAVLCFIRALSLGVKNKCQIITFETNQLPRPNVQVKWCNFW